MNIMQKIQREQLRMDIPKFKAGDTVKVHVRIIEGEKERVQVFQGIVLRVKRGATNSTFVVRKISDGIGVERVFPLNSPYLERVEVLSEGKVRQGRIFYLRKLRGKAGRIKTKNTWNRPN
ncbi:50S ribosomal protein L19 [Desulfonatronovibrio magnus]|uniref:50S ribosomal protein L19 n=1 Tax=Desulfonatronovibrio magnus TaxID=698827 RepID=UPI0005EBA6D7|nr:50S ribosomal protein L19 [Desulfonatronovibrio magnus]